MDKIQQLVTDTDLKKRRKFLGSLQNYKKVGRHLPGDFLVRVRYFGGSVEVLVNSLKGLTFLMSV